MIELKEKFTRELQQLTYRGEQVLYGGDPLYVRTLSGAEYDAFCQSDSSNISLLLLAVCDSEGRAVWTSQHTEWLKSDEVSGVALQEMVAQCLAHCFGKGIEAKHDAAAGNS